MIDQTNLLGCFISGPSLMHDASTLQFKNAKKLGDLFREYIWGKKGISELLKKLSSDKYGIDLVLVLFHFYVIPLPYELESLKEIESYRKKERAIAVPIVVNNENFFSLRKKDRYLFLKHSILQKIDVLENVVKKKKLDTNILLLREDLQILLEKY